MILNQKQMTRLIKRIEHLLALRNGEEFTAAELAELLDVNAYDVLFALLQMSGIERATHTSDGVRDSWCILPIQAKYIFEQVKVMLLADCR